MSTGDLDETLLERAMSALPAMRADLEALVTVESPSADLDAIARSADVVVRVGATRLGAEPERLIIDGCTHLLRRGPRVGDLVRAVVFDSEGVDLDAREI